MPLLPASKEHTTTLYNNDVSEATASLNLRKQTVAFDTP